ncbi:glycosyl transferase family 1 [Altererythrobacter sp. B11]|uniref:glycosyltransferase family 4 protein n=1 Tax=Altererythrobacter sp. B11 TaxID=2060312 RepID=UPI000DC74136|nr:glycosyltransferase family 4 protein [Altererythrobacter sp. B11]BBC70929.1 glycosyl transferase family 1 [Altererythrobacter sp. B11]
MSKDDAIRDGAAPVPGADIHVIFGRRKGAAPLRRIALIGTFAPRKCGIATFTEDVFEKLREFHPEVQVDIYALDDPAQPLRYENVAGVIKVDDRQSYYRAARRINESGVDAVWLQHEYGIYGGPDGELVCDFVDRMAAPLILTPHTVLTTPGDNQRRILEHLVSRASRTMVMSTHSRDLLAERYGAPNELLEVIQHGAPDRPFGRQEEFKQMLGLAGRHVLMTFGLLDPGKGIERVIEALPAIVARHPETVYRIVGATHPNLVAAEGEAYRERLQALTRELGVSDHVLWDNRFLETEELLDQLEACDIYITPYFNMQQSTSGTLSYAVALGKAVVSTPYLHARELLGSDAGRLIEPDCAEAVAREVTALLDDPAELSALQACAYHRGRQTIWPRFADAAATLIEAAVAAPPRPVPITAVPGLSGVFDMSDGTGMMQHAIGIVPDRDHGYCLDDNARALMLMNVAEGLTPAERSQWSLTYAAFMQHAWNPQAGAFRNFMRFDRSWAEDAGSEDSNGRALWVLGHTIEWAPDGELRDWAQRLFDTALPHCATLPSPRAMAFAMLGAAARLRVQADHGASRDLLEAGADFLSRLLDAARRPDWAWFEAVLGYDNPRLSQALIEAGQQLGRSDHVSAGLETLEWIAQQQISASGYFRPIGSDSFGQKHAHLPFDQQPLEAQAAIEAARAAFAATGDTRWFHHACTAWNWFFGANDRGVVLADLASGRCHDGINPRGVNANCGAESILAFQLARYSVLALAEAQRDSAGDGIEGRNCGREQSVANT